MHFGIIVIPKNAKYYSFWIDSIPQIKYNVFDAAELYFPIFIFIGITMWSFFTRGVTNSVEMVRANRGVVTRIYLPKYILLVSKLMVNAFKMLVSFAVIAVMLVIFRVRIPLFS